MVSKLPIFKNRQRGSLFAPLYTILLYTLNLMVAFNFLQDAVKQNMDRIVIDSVNVNTVQSAIC